VCLLGEQISSSHIPPRACAISFRCCGSARAGTAWEHAVRLCWTIDMDSILLQVLSGRQHVLEGCERVGTKETPASKPVGRWGADNMLAKMLDYGGLIVDDTDM